MALENEKAAEVFDLSNILKQYQEAYFNVGEENNE